MPSTNQIVLSLLLLVPYTLANNSSPQAQEVAVETILSDDAPESSSDQVPASGRTTDRSGGTEFGLPPVWAPVTDSSEFPLGGSESIDCDGTNLDQSQLTSRLRRSRLLDKREKSFCTNPQQFERLKPASEPVPGRGRSQTKGPGPGEGSGQQPAYPEPEDGAIQELLGQVKGRLGKSNGALCPSSNFNYRIPICVQIFPIRFSPAAKVEPARLWINWDACQTLFEDLWCCSIAKERISLSPSVLFSDPKFTARYRATGLVCRLVRDPYGLNN